MRRTRARVLASALVIGTAGMASATVALGVSNPHARPSVVANAGSDDGGLMAPDGGFMGSDGSDGGPPPPPDGSDGGPPDAGMDAPLPSIQIQEPTITLGGGPPPMGIATVITNNGGGLGSATIGSPNDVFRLYCGLTTCGYTNPPLPYSLAITCMPSTAPEVGMLTVFEASGGLGDSAMVVCPAMTLSPILSVSPDTLAFGSVPVGTTPSQQIFIANVGGGTLSNIVISFGGPNAAQWQSSACTSSSPCSVGAGSMFPVSITFAPTSHGSKDTTLTVTSNGGTDTVGLTGTGTGGVMSVKTPGPPMHILDFGTIPRGQPFTRMIELENTGNAPYTATTSMPAAPYSIAGGPLMVNAMSTATTSVTCQSATASANDNPQTVTITSNAYTGSPATVQLRCRIADTLLQITPTMFDFGEIRVGTQPEPTIAITLANPASSGLPAQVTAFALREQKPGLSLSTPATPFAIAPGMMQTASLQLSTAAETDLTGEYLELTVDGTQLQFPVTGKVVTPHSRIVPPNQLDLGTACIGTSVMGNVMLINDGTATLNVQPPEMDQFFVASAMGVPGTLTAGNSIAAQVSPGMSASGPVSGTLTWRDDVPSEHEISVVLDYVATGTALSPRGLDFGVVPVDAPPGAQQIRLQNCEMTASMIKIESLKTKQGTLGAWVIDPRVGYTKELGGREQHVITVSFEPPARGRYEADLTVQTASGRQIVHLVGDATGRDFDNTSFYACACSGTGAPERGWPVLLALVVVIARRRRVSS